MHNNSVIARLKAGVTPAQADADTRALVRSNAREMYPATLSGLAEVLGGSARPLTDEVSGGSRTLLWVACGRGFVLLIACADIASLMLARTLGREREIAVRSALGAGRGRLIRQLLAESAVLAVVGSILGLVLAVWLSRALVALAPPTLPRLHEIGIDGRILLFTAALTVVTALLCGILPALELSRPRGEALKEGARVSTGRRERRIRRPGRGSARDCGGAARGGGLLLRSFSRLMAVDPGSAPSACSPLPPAFPRRCIETRRAFAAFTPVSSTTCRRCRASVRSAPHRVAAGRPRTARLHARTGISGGA